SDLCGSSPDAAGKRTARRTGVAGGEIGPGLHPVLRARSQALSSAMDRRAHRGSRRRQGREPDAAAAVEHLPATYSSVIAQFDRTGASTMDQRQCSSLRVALATKPFVTKPSSDVVGRSDWIA